MGKATVLSRIPVHVEQAPPGARYFGVDDPEELADALADLAASHDPEQHARNEAAALNQLAERTRAFGQEYLDLLRRVHQHRPVAGRVEP